jgi:hypothetical protein
MRHYARFCALVLVALFFAISAGSDRAVAQTPTPTPIQAGQVIISEFRLRGPAGAEDEFIELYNNTNQAITVQALDTSGGWTVAISNGQITGPLFTIPNGTVIPARGHLLGANVNGYSLCNYPSGNGSAAPTPTPTPTQTGPCLLNGVNGTFTHTIPDRTWDFDVPDGSGVALFATTNGTNLSAGTRLDAAGFTPSPALYKEGAGIPSLVTANTEHTYYRDLRSGLPRDTADNASDFLLVGTAPGIQVTRLGAPGPENLASPIVNNTTIVPTLLDPSVPSTSPPNRARTFGMEPNGTFGTLLIRRTITNNTGQPVSRLRFRVINITTFGTPASECAGGSCADVRALTSQGGQVTVSGPTVVTVLGLRLEEPPEQPAGGGYNASLSADTITLATPLPAGQSINIEFKLGIERTGNFRFFVNTEALNGSAPATFNGPAASGVSANGGTNSKKRQLIMETLEPTPGAPAAPASPAAAPGEPAPRYVYVPWVINLPPPAPERTRAAEEEQDKKDEGKEKKSEEAPPSAPQAPAASAPDSPATAAEEPAPQSAPATTRRGAPKKLPAGAKARRGDHQ